MDSGSRAWQTRRLLSRQAGEISSTERATLHHDAESLAAKSSLDEHAIVFEDSAWQENDEQGGTIELIVGERWQNNGSRIVAMERAEAEHAEVAEVDIDLGVGFHQAFQLPINRSRMSTSKAKSTTATMYLR